MIKSLKLLISGSILSTTKVRLCGNSSTVSCVKRPKCLIIIPYMFQVEFNIQTLVLLEELTLVNTNATVVKDV